jgi:hypothetical protein
VRYERDILVTHGGSLRSGRQLRAYFVGHVAPDFPDSSRQWPSGRRLKRLLEKLLSTLFDRGPSALALAFRRVISSSGKSMVNVMAGPSVSISPADHLNQYGVFFAHSLLG